MRRLDGVYNLGVVLISQRVRRFGFLALLIAMVIGMALTGALPNLTQGEAGAASPTRLWSSGAELNSTTANMEVTDTAGTISISSSTKRSGDYAYRANPTSSTGTFYKTWANSAQSNKFWFRTYLWIADDPSADTYVLRVGNGSSGKISVRLTTASTLQLRNEEDNVNIGSASSALAANNWYRVEVFVDTTTLSSTDAELRLDGVSVASSTAENLAAGVDRLTWGSANSGTTDLFFDDLAINDSSGRGDNWPGEGKIVHLQPDGDGDNTAWIGDPNDTNDYDDIDEVTPNSDTDFIRSQTLNQLDDVNLESASGAGITANDYIKLVSIGVRIKICGSATGGPACLGGNGDINYKTRLKASASGTTEESAITGIDDSVTGYSTNNDDTAKLNALTVYDLPGTSTAAWTTADLDSAQIGIRNSDSNGTGFRTTAMWLQVEYVPRSGGRLFSSGFELNSTVADEEWSTINGSPTISTTTVRSGTYAGRISSLASGARQAFNYQFKTSNSDGAFYLRTYFRISTAPSGENRIVDWRSSGGAAIVAATIDGSRVLRLYDEDGQVTGTTTITANTWVRLEIKFLRNGASSEVTARVNGADFATATNRDLSTGVTQVGLGGNLNSEAQITGDWFFDDIAINESGGTNQSSYPGPGKIIHLKPDSSGDNSGWTTSAPGTNYTFVDEVTPNEATDYVSTGTTNTIDDYNLENSPIGTNDQVNLVSVGARFNAASATQEDFRVRIKDAANGVPIESVLLSPASTTWVTNQTSAPYAYPLTAYTRPEQNTAWTDAQLDNAQIGIRDISGSGTAQVSTLWLLVEFTPTVSGTIYQTDEISALNCSSGGNRTVRIKVGGGSDYTSDCSTSAGTYPVIAVDMSAGDVLAVYLDGETEKAATYTVATGNALTGIDLYQDRLTTRCDNSCSLTNANINTWDKDNDSDIHATAAVITNIVTVDNDWKLLIKANTYAPGSSVTLSSGGSNSYSGDVSIAAGATLNMSTSQLSVGGSFDNDGTFSKSSAQTTILTSQKTDETLSDGSNSFENLEIDNGIVGYWKFDEGTGTSASDASGDGQTGTFTGSPSWTTSVKDSNYYGANSGAVTFSGSNYMSRTAGTVLKPANNLTVTAWIKAAGTDSSGGEVVSMGDDYIIRLTTGGDVQVYFYDGAAWRTCTSSGVNVLDNNWHAIVYLKSGSNGQKIYIDNVQRDPGSGDCTNTSNISYAHGTTFNVGRHGNGNTAYDFVGSIDDVRVYNRVLTSTEISQWSGGSHPTGGTYTLQDALDIDGNLGLRTGKIDVDNSGNYATTVGGSWTGVADFTPRAATVTFDGTATGKTIQADSAFYNLTINGSGGGWSLDKQRLKADNNFQITNGTLDSSAAACYNAASCNVTINNNLTGNSGTWTLTLRSATWTVSGDWNTSAIAQDSLSINENTSTVVMDGSGTKTITTGSTNVYEARFYNLNVGAAAGKTTKMLQSFGYSGVLTLGAGTFDLNSNDIYPTGNTASPLSLNGSGTWGTGNGLLRPGGSITLNIPGFTYNSGLRNEMSTGGKVLLQGTTTFTGDITLGCCSRASELDTGNQTLTVGGNLVFNTSTAILTAGSSTITVGGSWTNQSGAVFTAGSSTVVFNATTSGKTITSAGDSFNNLTFNGSGGGWTIADALGVNADLTIQAGTLSGTKDVTVNDDLICNTTCGSISLTGGTFSLLGSSVDFGSANLASNWTFNSLVMGTASQTGLQTAAGTGTITISSVLTIAGSNTFDAGEKTYDLTGSSGTPFVDNGSFSANTSTIRYLGENGLGNTNINDVSYYSLVAGKTPTCSTETYVLTAATTITNNLTIQSCGTLDVVSGQNYALSIGGSYVNSGTFTGRNGTVTFNSTSTGKTLSGTLNGSSAFYNLTFNGSGGGWTNSTALLVTNDLTTTSGTLSGTNNVTVNGNVAGTSGAFNLTGGTFEQRVASNKNFGTTSGATNWAFNDLTFSDGESAVCLGVSITTQTGGSGGISVANVLKVGKSGDTCATSLGAGNRSWTLSGVGGDPFQLLASPAGALSSSSSTFIYTGNCPTGGCNTTVQAAIYNHLNIDNASETFVLEGATAANGNLTITNGTLDTVSGQNYDLAVKGNWTNNGTFTARNGTVTLSGSSTQALSGTMTGSSSFYKLTLTNSSGTDASDCERTSFVPGIDFAASASVTNDYTITTASARVEYNDGSTYTIANINWNGQASGTRIYFRNSASSGDWNLNVSGTQTAVSYVNVSRSDAAGGNTIGAHNGTNVDCGNNVNWSFANPNSPASLAQKKTNDTVLATGDWTNETSVKFTADISDGDNPATIQLCVEKDLLGTSFSNTEDSCGSTVSYSGSAVAASVTISSLTDASEYHWQARVKDSGGAYSSWVSYDVNAETARDFGVDTTACTYADQVYDGPTEDVDVSYNDGSLTALSANWDAFTCTVSGLNKYQYSIGTTAGSTDVKGWTDNSTTESVTSTSLNLQTNQRYFFNVRAVDNASNTSSVTSSNGQDVLPSISFSLVATAITFANLNDNNNRSDTKTLTLTTSTNAYGGYVIRQYATGLLTGGATTIPNFQGGTYASPASWPSAFCTSGSNCGYGYTSSDTTIGGTDKFGGATLYAPFSLSAFGDIVADHTDAVNGTSGAVVNEQYTLTHKVAVDALQIAKPYQTEVLYIVTGTF